MRLSFPSFILVFFGLVVGLATGTRGLAFLCCLLFTIDIFGAMWDGVHPAHLPMLRTMLFIGSFASIGLGMLWASDMGWV